METIRVPFLVYKKRASLATFRAGHGNGGCHYLPIVPPLFQVRPVVVICEEYILAIISAPRKVMGKFRQNYSG